MPSDSEAHDPSYYRRGTVPAPVDPPAIGASYKKTWSGTSWDDHLKAHVYTANYTITLEAISERVRIWEVSFDGLPAGTAIIEKPSNVYVDRKFDGTDGRITLHSQEDTTIDPGQQLQIALRLRFPSAPSDDQMKLKDLIAQRGT